uniref:Uncharacterized protein n=1 Tax=Plectus sambesii TaxID=2011161 RepID=A0A914USS4_9BILA
MHVDSGGRRAVDEGSVGTSKALLFRVGQRTAFVTDTVAASHLTTIFCLSVGATERRSEPRSVLAVGGGLTDAAVAGALFAHVGLGKLGARSKPFDPPLCG